MSFNIGGLFQSLIQALPFMPKAPEAAPAPQPAEAASPAIKMASDSSAISRSAATVMAANQAYMPPNTDLSELDLSRVIDESSEIISNNGGNIISNNGGTLISNNGGNIISNNGANLLGADTSR
jgi:hypothetical protein